MKLLFDLLPVILFFIAFKIAGIYVATGVSIAATVLQILWMAVRHRRVDPMLWVSFAIVAVFGGATLLLDDPTFIKWKPTALYWASSIALLGGLLLGKQPLRALLSSQLTLPDPVWSRLTVLWAVFFAVLGVLNIVIAYHVSTDVWVNYKLFGGAGLTFLFIIAQSVWLGKHLKEQ
ncbi:septation protein A [Chitinasiproducens palmae]|uniref:Inner membrane-spanning protein YciB n=1 Tax=Chitinasiproducens palmae TaxID=1770053 RepID=A0A1H2PVX3_9BURK|nr:septation protein A [Chitinasiproducens palmae]SDV51462.1 intracellular septation protein [Chitinasiproducens palmae]